MLASVWRELRHAARRLGRAPRFTIAAAVMLAAGIGLTAGLFTILNVTALSPWPVDRPEQLAWVMVPTRSGESISIPLSEYRVLHDQTRTLQGLAAVRWGAALMASKRGGETDGRSAAWVTGNFFEVAGFRTIAGRSLQPADDQPGAPPVAVVSERWWRRWLNADPGAIGRTIFVRDRPVTLVGVLAHRYAT